MSDKTTLDVEGLSVSPQVQAMLDREQKAITPLRVGYGLVAIAILIYAGQESDLDLLELIQGSGNMAEYSSRYFPPDFSDWRLYLEDTLETIAMGLWGTLLAAILAVPWPFWPQKIFVRLGWCLSCAGF